jgi:hypothetical protein
MMASQSPIKDHSQRSLEHYRAIYRTLSPAEIARRCALPFRREESAFELRIMGKTYLAEFPEFKLQPEFTLRPESALSGLPGEAIQSAYEEILFLRYLCEGNYRPPEKKEQLSYRDIPWGNVYFKNFEGRCIRRFAASFGKDIPAFKRVMEENPGLKAVPLAQGDAGYRFEFSSGLFMSLLLWAADDEFPPSAQILFDDNFPAAFTAEDIAVACEVVITRLRALVDKQPA